MDGILCVNKPEGFTSFDVIAKMRGIARCKKIGHGGTLDPMATGVLPLYFGAATRAVDMVPGQKKEYRATFLLGRTTDTLDRTGTLLETRPVRVGRAEVLALLPRFTGEQEQLPPMYSAVSVGCLLYTSTAPSSRRCWGPCSLCRWPTGCRRCFPLSPPMWASTCPS